MVVLAVLAAGAAAQTTTAPAASQPAPSASNPSASIAQDSCFWYGPVDTAFGMSNPATNAEFPDTAAVYWSSQVTMPAGSSIVFNGQFAHALYQSFTTYSAATRDPIDSLSDVGTQPDPGSTNPFAPGADRTASQRSYTVTMYDQPLPAQKAANTLYAGANGQTEQTIIYRVYLPDSFTPADVTGGVGLPTPTLVLADGSTETGQALCQTLAPLNGPLPLPTPAPLLYRLWRGLPGQPATFPAAPTPVFSISDNYWFRIECRVLGNCDYYPNPDNRYMWAYVNRGFAAGPVLVLHGELPTAPITGPDVTTMGTGDMRYWSMCQNSVYSTAGAGCVNDTDVPVGADGEYTIVTSLPQDRPANATAQCGVAWIAWPAAGDGDGHLNDGLLIVRNMLPAPAFPDAIQDVTSQRALQTELGAYYPEGSYTTTAAFQQLGCPA